MQSNNYRIFSLFSKRCNFAENKKIKLFDFYSNSWDMIDIDKSIYVDVPILTDLLSKDNIYMPFEW